MAASALPTATAECDIAVIGGGIVGCSIAWGLVKRGQRVTVLDEGDRAHRASRGNFGMIWVQGKGLGYAPYARLTRAAADAWTGFAAELKEASGIDPRFHQPGGLGFCLGEAEFEARGAAMARLSSETGGLFRFEMRSGADIRRELPWLGSDVAGAVYCPDDGGANPLALLLGLQSALTRAGASILTGRRIEAIARNPEGVWELRSAGGAPAVRATRIVLAAGLGNAALAPMVGLEAPVRPVRGQILVTERVAPFMPYVSSVFRQMDEGSCLIGDTTEEVGFDEGVLPSASATMARRALRVCPPLAGANLMRTWGALRIMTPDGLPVYSHLPAAPGALPDAWLATVHSGVTLAPIHAALIPEAILSGALPAPLVPFPASRFRETPRPDQSSSH